MLAKPIKGLDVGKANKRPCQHLGPEFRQFSTRKKILGQVQRFLREKIILCEKGDEISGLDGSQL